MRILTLSQLSLAGSSGIAEVKQPIWWGDGTNGAATSSSTPNVISDGTTTAYSTGSAAPTGRLFTLSSNWPNTVQLALEVTGTNSGTTSTYELWDWNTASAVTASQVQITSTTNTVVRSGKFTLTPGHTYGVALYTNNTSYTATVCDASLIIFPS